MAEITSNKIRGLEGLISIDGKVVGGQRGAALSMSADELDITDKTTEGYKAFLVGLKEWNISCDGLVCTDDTGYQALFTAFLNGSVVQVQFKQEDGTFNLCIRPGFSAIAQYVVIDGHEYLFVRHDRGGGITHSPKCDCHSR